MRFNLSVADLYFMGTVHAHFISILEPGHVDADVSFEDPVLEVRLKFKPVSCRLNYLLEPTLNSQGMCIIQVYASRLDYVDWLDGLE